MHAAGSDDAARIGEDPERDDAGNLLRLGQIGGEIFGDFSRVQGTTPTYGCPTS